MLLKETSASTDNAAAVRNITKSSDSDREWLSEWIMKYVKLSRT